MLMLNRAFFSLQSNWVPTLVALANLCVNAALDAVFYRFGTWGIPLATSVANVVGSVILFILLRRRLASLEVAPIADSFIRIVGASVVLAGISFGVWYALDQALGRSFLGQLVSVSGALAAGTVAYLLACWALRVRELGALLALRRRFGDATP
jgi:putative peptidoglycan lipid II flippase